MACTPRRWHVLMSSRLYDRMHGCSIVITPLHQPPFRALNVNVLAALTEKQIACPPKAQAQSQARYATCPSHSASPCIPKADSSTASNLCLTAASDTPNSCHSTHVLTYYTNKQSKVACAGSTQACQACVKQTEARRTPVGHDPRGVLAQRLDVRKDHVPAPAVEPCRVLAQLIQNLVHLERRRQRLNQHRRLREVHTPLLVTLHHACHQPWCTLAWEHWVRQCCAFAPLRKHYMQRFGRRENVRALMVPRGTPSICCASRNTAFHRRASRWLCILGR